MFEDNSSRRNRNVSLRKDDQMKRTIWMAIGVLLLLGSSLASAQSLGEAARSTRKAKAHQTATNHHYDNDNLPVNDHISVVGQAPAANANSANQTADGSTQTQAAPLVPPVDPKVAAADRQKAADEWKDKLDGQKKKIESLNHELDLTQREYRLRAAAMYSDAGNRLRNSAQWDKDDADFKKQLEEKQKAVDTARQELETMQEQARKAGIRERE
jgi:hypothetical protein